MACKSFISPQMILVYIVIIPTGQLDVFIMTMYLVLLYFFLSEIVWKILVVYADQVDMRWDCLNGLLIAHNTP